MVATVLAKTSVAGGVLRAGGHRRWKPRRRRLPHGPRPKVVPDTRPSVTSPIPSRPHLGERAFQAYNCQAVVDRPGRGRGPPTRLRISNRLPMIAIDNVGAVPRGSICLLLGKGSRRALCSGRGPVRRAGADPPRSGCATRAPRSHTSVSQGPDAIALALRMQTVEPVFGQIQGRVSGSSCCTGVGEHLVADPPATTCSNGGGQSAWPPPSTHTESTGPSPTHPPTAPVNRPSPLSSRTCALACRDSPSLLSRSSIQPVHLCYSLRRRLSPPSG